MKVHREKLQRLFADKFRELAFEFTYAQEKKTWREYVKSVGCHLENTSDNTLIADNTFIFKDENGNCTYESKNIVILDPSPFGRLITMSPKIAEKILVLGLP